MSIQAELHTVADAYLVALIALASDPTDAMLEVAKRCAYTINAERYGHPDQTHAEVLGLKRFVDILCLRDRVSAEQRNNPRLLACEAEFLKAAQAFDPALCGRFQRSPNER
jgi:hypothetical protein